MEIPILASPSATRQTVDTFYGYDHNLRIADGRFYEMENMTSDHFPVLSVREKRGLYAQIAQPRAMASKEALCYIDGPALYVGDKSVPGLALSDGCDDCPHPCHRFAPGKMGCQKQMVNMGAYLLIFPDKMWVRPGEEITCGSMETVFQNQGKDVRLSLCRADGTGYGTVPSAPPENPKEGQVYQDGNVLMEYIAGVWTAVQTTYVSIFCHGIGEGFSQYDGITIEGLPEISGSAVVWKAEQDTLIIAGMVTQQYTVREGVTVSRLLPDMDYVLSCGNRLWGCRYGQSRNGDFVNEIYCSKLGDFKNFNCFMGISTDSGVLHLGSDGPFTGATQHLDHPLFFKENMLHKVYISEKGAHSVSDTPCRGVQQGCHKSLAIVNEVLYYKSQNGICAYDGSLPVQVSDDLGMDFYEKAVAGSVGNKYYISMEQGDESHLFVYDTAKGLWHREDGLKVIDFCAFGRELYAMADDKIWAMLGSVGQPEGSVNWSAQTGPIGLNLPQSKYLSRLTVRLLPEKGSQVTFYVRYNFDPRWEKLCTVTGEGLGSFDIPIRPKRCDTMVLKLEGSGPCKVFSFTKTLEKGSDTP